MGRTAQKDYFLMVEKQHDPRFTVLDHSYISLLVDEVALYQSNEMTDQYDLNP